MNLRRHIVSLSVTAALTICGAAQAAEGAHWSYKGHGGPAEWGSMDAAFASCKLGKLQSPIDIVGAKPAKLAPIKFNYKPSTLKIIDNGHTVQVDYAPGSAITVEGNRYDLVQFHFHKPSEETTDGKHHAMVAHLVHRNSEGNLAVVAVLLDSGTANALVETLWTNIPREKQKQGSPAGVAINAADLLP